MRGANGSTGQPPGLAPSNAACPGDGGGGHLADNVLLFVRLLRASGLPLGTGKALDAVHAALAVGVSNRDDFYWTLHAVLVNRREQRDVFDQAFHVFWRNPHLLERLTSLVLPDLAGEPPAPDATALSRRVSEALQAGLETRAAVRETPPEVEIDATLTWSAEEMLRRKDFEQMSTAEMAAARRLMQRMRLPIAPAPTRRFRPGRTGPKLDLRATLRASLRSGPDAIRLVWSRRRLRAPPLVILCDVSGSMSRYSRMLLHFAHAVTNDRDRVHSFVFGTRLTNITRHLRRRDVDAALDRVAAAVEDWSGGTRIGHCMHEFNRRWARRVLGQGALVLLITDGLDRDVGEGLAGEVERLQKSCRRLLWLNPLLRYEGFEARALGMRAMLPHVDELRSVHNLASLEELVAVLSSA